MYVAVAHRVEEQAILSRAEGMGDASNAAKLHPRLFCPSKAPRGVRPRMFCPSQDLSAAALLLEADSVEAVRDYVELMLGRSSEYSYFEINAELARGLPRSPIAGA